MQKAADPLILDRYIWYGGRGDLIFGGRGGGDGGMTESYSVCLFRYVKCIKCKWVNSQKQTTPVTFTFGPA